MAQVSVSALIRYTSVGPGPEVIQTINDVVPWEFSWGISDNSPINRVADVGSFSFAVDNSAGLYTPGGPSGSSAWHKGARIEIFITYAGNSKLIWRGRLDDIDIRPNVKDKKAYAQAVDWLDYAVKKPIINPGILSGYRGNEVLEWLIDNMDVPPALTDFDIGTEIFPTALDTITSKTKAYHEFVKVAQSELGYIYLRHLGSETLVFESANARHGWNIIPTGGFLLLESGDYLLLEDGGKMLLDGFDPLTFDDTVIEDFDVTTGDQLINRMSVYAYPRRLDTSPQVLFTLNEELVIASNTTFVLKGNYANPQGGLPINAQDMITPVITTDYTMFSATDGGGSDISSDLDIDINYGTEGFTARLTNNNAGTGFVNKFKPRGTGIYLDNPIEHVEEDEISITAYDTQSESLSQKYKNDLASATIFSKAVVEDYKDPHLILNSISFTANKSATAMQAFLTNDVGDLRRIEIDELGLAGNYYIQGIEVAMQSGIVRATYKTMLALSLATNGGLSALAVEFRGVGFTDGINFGIYPKVNDLTTRTVSFWIYHDTNTQSRIVSWGTGYIIGTPSGTNNAIYVYQIHTGPGNVTGIWITPANSLSLGQWVHVLVTHDVTTPTTDPLIYINNVSQTLTETSTPVGPVDTNEDDELVLGNSAANSNYDFAVDGKLFDVRIYNRVVSSSERTSLYNSGTPDETKVTDPTTGLIFQAFAVRTTDLASYTDITLTESTRLRDAIFGAVGTPHGSPIGRSAP